MLSFEAENCITSNSNFKLIKNKQFSSTAMLILMTNNYHIYHSRPITILLLFAEQNKSPYSALHVAQPSPQSSPLRDEPSSRANNSVDGQSIPFPQTESTGLSLGLPVLPESPQHFRNNSSAMDTNDSLHVGITAQDFLLVEKNSIFYTFSTEENTFCLP